MKVSCIAIASMLMLGAAVSLAEETPAARHRIELSPELMALLRAEMAQIAGGVQSLAMSLPAGDWKSIRETSERMRASYIMERALTPDQVKELGDSLPEHFKQLDAQFHRRATKLGVAAQTRDHELVVFHYSRLLESCADCHAAYAADRFPGFETRPGPAHHH